MTIRTREPEIPTEFPPARLFLDDIEEIVRILVDANKNSNSPAPHDEDARIKVTFIIKDQVCDEVEELPKIAKKTTELLILLESETGLAANSLRFYRDGSILGTYVLTEEGHLRLFHKLAPIFKRRNLWLRTLVRSHYAASMGMLLGMCLGTATVPVVFVLRKHIPVTRAIVASLLLVPMIITLWTSLSRHSIIIMRHSSEPSALRQELLQKAPLAAISSVLTFLLTLLGMYLKHKFWP